MIKRLYKGLLILLLGIALSAGVAVFEYQRFLAAPLNPEQAVRFEVRSGDHIRSVANRLVDAGLLQEPWMMIIGARLSGQDVKIKAGEYEIPEGSTPKQLLDLFVSGKSIQYGFTLIEGWSFRQMRAFLAQSADLEHKLSAEQSDAEIMAVLGFAGEHPEGRFYPDTYLFPKGTTDIEFLQRAYRRMQTILTEEWAKREEGLPLKTPYEALILASIVEKETGAAFERPLIAAAFIERLRRKMKLQTDPTIIYGMGEEYDGDIRYRDLRRDTPYNTYIHRGLTPTPIAMPGRAAIHAVLHPADSKAIFFVSKGDGTHQFSHTLKEHNAAVRKYQLNGKAPKRKAESGQ